MLHPQPLTDVFEAAAYGQGSRSQHGTLQLRPKAFAEDRTNINRSRLKKNILPPASLCVVAGLRRVRCPSAPAFNPEDRIAVFRFQSVPKLHLNLLGPA